MDTLEEAVVEFVKDRFDKELGQIEQVKDEFEDLQASVNALEEKVDTLVEKLSKESKQGDTDQEEDSTESHISSRTLRSIRDRYDLTQKDLAYLLDVSSATVGSWERGDTEPQKANRVKIKELREKSKEDVDEMLVREEKPVEAKGIRPVRENHGLTQEEFAEKLGVTPTTVSNWEQGETTPRAEMVDRIQNIGVGEEDTEDSLTGDDVKQIRNNKGLSQSEFAEKLGVSAGTISNWERGKGSPSEEIVEQLQEV